MFYDPLSVSNEEENAQNILCINDHRQWASPMFTINENQAKVCRRRRLRSVNCRQGVMSNVAFPVVCCRPYILKMRRNFVIGITNGITIRNVFQNVKL